MQQKLKVLLVVIILVAGGALLIWGPTLHSVSSDHASDLNIPPHIASRFAPPGMKHYWNVDYQFSLFYPESFLVVEHAEEHRAGTIVFQDPDTLEGFQIYIVPYFSDTITEEQFRKDMPSGVRRNEQQVFVDGREFVAFIGEDGILGETLEVWGIAYGFLYEITAPVGSEGLMRSIASSWKFF